MLLQAFGASQTAIDQVRVDLTPTTITIAPTIQQVPVPLFGNPQTIQITPPPMNDATTPPPVQPPAVPNWTINVDVSSSTIPVNTGFSRLRVTVYDKNGVFAKVPVTVTTNDPDLPPSFVINQDGMADFFCVAPHTDINNGCPVANPVTAGTFDFTFTVEDVSTTVRVVVTP